MPNRTDAEEHLRIIRSLMEKATIYRAISAPTALVGGLVSVAFGGWLYLRWRPLPQGVEAYEFGQWFSFGWVAVLFVTMAANGLLIWRAARKRNEPFISPAMRKALWALFPSMLCGAFFTLVLSFMPGSFLAPTFSARWWLPPIWMTCYGLGLLATTQFAPRSIPILGWCFLIAGLSTFVVDYLLEWTRLLGHGESHQPTVANLLMVGTFGLFHLIYAACTWPRRHREGDIGDAP
jgi:hypothetical protein